jgi:hypothetical protein
MAAVPWNSSRSLLFSKVIIMTEVVEVVVWPPEEEVLLNRTSSQPRFLLGKLEARRSYTLNIYSFNSKVRIQTYTRTYRKLFFSEPLTIITRWAPACYSMIPVL